MLTIAAMISVPPVLPFDAKATPIPPPQKIAPRIQAIKGWFCNSWSPAVNCCITERKNVRTKTANTVFTLNFHPKIFNESNSKKPLMAK